MLSLDVILETTPAPPFNKIDVEGSEWAVLQGAERLINEANPTFVVEVVRKTRKQVIAFLQSKKYQLHELHTGCDLNTDTFSGSDILAQPE